MDFSWTTIGYAVLLGGLLIVAVPRALQLMKDGPKGSNSDWWGAIKPLLFVVGFVIVLILLVR